VLKEFIKATEGAPSMMALPPNETLLSLFDLYNILGYIAVANLATEYHRIHRTSKIRDTRRLLDMVVRLHQMVSPEDERVMKTQEYQLAC
jgi:hypothetical protein